MTIFLKLTPSVRENGSLSFFANFPQKAIDAFVGYNDKDYDYKVSKFYWTPKVKKNQFDQILSLQRLLM
jgi:hypothetical protein